jgi:hypothetical protein
MSSADLQWARRYVSRKLGDDRIQVERITTAVLQGNADELCNVGSWIIYVIMHILSYNPIRIISGSPVNKVLLAYGIEGIQPLVNILVYGIDDEYVELVDNELRKQGYSFDQRRCFMLERLYSARWHAAVAVLGLLKRSQYKNLSQSEYSYVSIAKNAAYVLLDKINDWRDICKQYAHTAPGSAALRDINDIEKMLNEILHLKI